MQNFYKLKGRTFILFSLLSLFSYTLFAQVGINTITPTTTLDVNGALSLREHPEALVVKNGINNAINLGSNPYSQYRIEAPTLAFSIGGIIKVTEADGQLVRLINNTDQIMTIVNNASSTAPLRKIFCPSGSNLILAGKNSSVTLQYSKEFSKWTVFSYTITSNNKHSVFGNTDVVRGSDTMVDLPGLSITFTPRNSIVYVTFTVYGDVNDGETEGRFQLMMNETVVGNTQMRTGKLSSQTPYRITLPMHPLNVIPGTSVTLQVQWASSGANTFNSPLSWPSHGRYMTVID